MSITTHKSTEEREPPKRSKQRLIPASYRVADELVRVLSSPDTTEETRGALRDALFELSKVTQVDLDHPEIVRLAYLTMVRVIKDLLLKDAVGPEVLAMHDANLELRRVLTSSTDAAARTRPALKVIKFPDGVA